MGYTPLEYCLFRAGGWPLSPLAVVKEGAGWHKVIGVPKILGIARIERGGVFLFGKVTKVVGGRW